MVRIVVLLVLLLGGGAAAEAANLQAGEPLTERFAEALVTDAFQADGFRTDDGEDVRIVIDQPRLPLGNQATVDTEVVLADLDHDDGRFRGTLVGTVDGEVRFRLPMHGRVQALLRVPALRRPLAAGELVTADDLIWVSLPPKRLPAGSMMAPEEIVGSEARRRLAAGRALRERDLRAPRLVRRGQPVELVYSGPGLRLSALGVAQEDGELGALVQVINANSRRQLQGLVTGPDEVTLGTTRALAP